MYIPEEKISEILNVSDIVQVVAESVILKKSGINYFGLCPFHTEKTPSFSVNSQKQIFHCFGCGAGGNVFSFLMKYHGITFPEAARMLARQHDITIETGRISPAQQEKAAVKEGLFRLNRQIMKLYADCLKNDPSAGRARQYLLDRGTTKEMVEQFGLGYAKDSWDFVTRSLASLNIPSRVAAASGLVVPKKSGTGFYDRFRNRIIFPIVDINMQVAGFGGRVMDDSMPKYLNSPETPVYNKSRILYGLHAAKSHCRQMDHVYIVEGYFDFLTLFQHGIQNCVASLGTSLTSHHVRLLKGFASRMVLVFDSDTAGINAAKRSIKTFVKEGVDVRIMILPDDNDPDSFVAASGAEAFNEMAKGALNAVEFLTQTAVKKHGLSVAGRVKVLDEMKSHLALIQDSALRSVYIKDLAEKINIDEKAVMEKVKKAVSREQSTFNDNGLPEQTGLIDEPASNPREAQIISIMLQYPGIHETVVKTGVLDYFYSPELRSIGETILRVDPGRGSLIPNVMARLSDRDQGLIASLAIKETDPGDNVEQIAADLIARIIRVRKKEENTLNNRISSAEKECDADLFELLEKKQKEIQQLHVNKH